MGSHNIVINDVKQNSSNAVVKSDKFLRLGPRLHEKLYGSFSKDLLRFLSILPPSTKSYTTELMFKRHSHFLTHEKR